MDKYFLQNNLLKDMKEEHLMLSDKVDHYQLQINKCNLKCLISSDKFTE
jgi:hypothetical protein